MSNAIIATGILLKRGDGALPVENFVAVAEQVTLKPPQWSRNEVDVSTHNAGVESKILGMLRTGQVTGTCNWLPTDATQSYSTGILGDIFDNTKRNWQIALPGDQTNPGYPIVQFNGQVQLIDPQEASVDAALQIAFAITLDAATLEIIEEPET